MPVAAPFELDELYTQHGLGTLVSFPVTLVPGGEYKLEVEASAGRFVGHEFTVATTPTPRNDLSGASPLLAYLDSRDPPQLISTCSAQKADEVAVLNLKIPQGIAYVVAKAQYSGGQIVSDPVVRLTGGGVAEATFTFWAEQQGAPCVELTAYAADGTLADTRTVCEVGACGDISQFDSSRSQLESMGTGVCPPSMTNPGPSAFGCVCAASGAPWASEASALFFGFVLLGFAIRKKRI